MTINMHPAGDLYSHVAGSGEVLVWWKCHLCRWGDGPYKDNEDGNAWDYAWTVMDRHLREVCNGRPRTL